MSSVSLKTGDLSLLVIAILQIVSKDSRLEDFVWRVALVCVWVGEAGRRRTFRNQGLAEGSKIMEAGSASMEMEYLDPQPPSL